MVTGMMNCVRWVGGFLVVFAVNSLAAGVVSRDVSYEAGSVTAKGFFVAPDDGKRHPGVLVVHEWWGQDGYARERAKMLAELGYAAMAVDMYGDGKVAEHPKDARAFVGAVLKDMPEARRRFEAALKFFRAQPEVEPDKVAAIGYCFGGTIVLQMAAEGVPGLLAVASFHGLLNAEVPGGVKPFAKMLVCHGEADAYVKPEDITAFKKRMAEAGVDVAFVTYPGALHGFTNPDATAKAKEFDLNVGYDADADKKSWAEMKKFLKSAFGEK